jgi:hypothetical protein
LSLIPIFNKNLPLGSYRVKNLHTSCPNSNRPVFGLKEF